MKFVTRCMWCIGIKDKDVLFPVNMEAEYPNQKPCCGDNCRHWYDEGGCPQE